MKSLTIGLALLWSAFALSAEPGACDVAAAHPSDPDKVAPGVAAEDVVTHVAIPACRSAVEREPGNARLRYQLGRALVYWAGANEADDAEGIAEVEAAAELGYRQAQFVSGLLRAQRGDLCAAEPLYKAAADQGLKSARLTYVDDMLAGRYANCRPSASRSEMSAFLEGATTQVNGYYENMLLASLKRQLTEWR